MKKLVKLFQGLTLCVCCVVNVWAQEEPVDKLFEVMSMEEQLSGGFDAMLPLIDQMAARFNLDAQGKEELKGIYRQWFNEDIDTDKVMGVIKELYVASFTSEELLALVDFYQTPVGKKFLAKSNELMQAGAQAGMQEAQSKQAQLLQRLQPFLAKHNIN